MGVSTWEWDLRRIGGIQGTNEEPVADERAGCGGKGDAFAVRRHRRHLVEEEVQFVGCGYLEMDLCGGGGLFGKMGRDPDQGCEEERCSQASRQPFHVRSRLRRFATMGAGMPAFDPDSVIHSSSLRRSPAVCQRSSGDLARHFLTRRSSAGEAIGWMVETGGGLKDITAVIRLAWLEPTKLLRPVIIS